MKMQLYCPFCGKTTEWLNIESCPYEQVDDMDELYDKPWYNTYGWVRSTMSFKEVDSKKDLECSICHHSQDDAEKQMYKPKS